MGYPLKKSSSVFANTEPKAPYGQIIVLKYILNQDRGYLIQNSKIN